jgi:hypothetical protein
MSSRVIEGDTRFLFLDLDLCLLYPLCAFCHIPYCIIIKKMGRLMTDAKCACFAVRSSEETKEDKIGTFRFFRLSSFPLWEGLHRMFIGFGRVFIGFSSDTFTTNSPYDNHRREITTLGRQTTMVGSCRISLF